MIEGFADFAQFVDFFPVLFPFSLEGEAALRQFSDLNFIILGIEELSFWLFEFNSQHLDFIWESLYFNSLKHNNELNIVAQICFLVVWQILDPWPIIKFNFYLLKSSP